MRYEIHRFEVNKEIDREQLKTFLNGLKGEVISIIPHMNPQFHLMGATATLNYLIIVEKLYG